MTKTGLPPACPSPLQPRLRFPEFQTSASWDICPLASTVRITQGGTPSTQIAGYWQGGMPWITPAEMGNLVSKYITKTVRTLTAEGLRNCSSELLPAYSLIISTRAPIGYLVINKVPMAINQGCKGLIPKAKIDADFIYFTLERSKTQLNDIGSGNTFKELSANALGSFKIVLPSLPEQQKIADCLSSLDEVIEAQTQKLRVLKLHKKALMSRLFPVADAGGGGVIPRLRFPEFKEAGEWRMKKLKDISNQIIERVGDRKLIPVSISAGLGFVPQAEKFGRDISGNQYQKYILVRDGNFVYNKGNSLKFPQGCIYELRGWGEVAAPNVFICFRLNADYVNGFFQYCFEKNVHGLQLKEHITSGARSNGLLNISKEKFFEIKIPVSSKEEQQKIADCLSSLDEVIEARGKKITTLKKHKKSLMQRLFPIVH